MRVLIAISADYEQGESEASANEVIDGLLTNLHRYAAIKLSNKRYRTEYFTSCGPLPLGPYTIQRLEENATNTSDVIAANAATIPIEDRINKCLLPGLSTSSKQ
jgi:hypothetical protein